jgi:peptidyl-prolyl cis-trans isomerase NIMA-interacting 4
LWNASILTKDTDEDVQCEKHSKKEEALAKLREGVKFDEVARDFSEDKARQGR